MNELKQYGLIVPEDFAPEEYILGGSELPALVLQPDGQWDKWLPPAEIQNRYVEPCNCTAYGTLSTIETLMRRKYGFIDDFSERALGILAGTYPPGNDPHKVCETVRKAGIVPDASLPYTEDIDTLAEYYSPNPLTPQLAKLCADFLAKWTVKHEWVFYKSVGLKDKQARLKEALKYSPVALSVYAWKQRNGLYFKEAGDRDNHWTMLYGYEEGKYWKIFDSYDNTLKQLEWNFDFEIAKRFHIELNGPPPTDAERSIFQRALAWCLEQLKALSIVTVAHQELPQIAPELVIEPTPEPKKPESIEEMVLRVCKEEGLSPEMTTRLFRTVACESEFNPKAVNKNADGTSDYGICQYNEFWYIGKGKPIASIDEALSNPEKCIRVMCNQFKKGRERDWICNRKLFPKVVNT